MARLSNPPPLLELVSLSKLSSDLELLVLDPDLACCDAEVAFDGGAVPVGIHRCILAARSNFFRDLFARPATTSGKLRYEMSELLPHGRVGREAFVALLGFLYTGRLKPPPPEVSTCVDGYCSHGSCRPVIDFAVELMYTASVFQIAELVEVLECHLLNLVEEALVEDVIPVLLASFHSQHTQLLSHCIQRVARSDLDSFSLEKELPPKLNDDIKLLRRSEPTAYDAQNVNSVHARTIKRIHGALDSDDVELLKLLLNESYVTLDDANALHYAAAYCDPRVVGKVLQLHQVNVNCKNERGYTPLHLAAIRREPAIIISLLTKGASAFIPTTDGRSVVSICRRLTKAKDYFEKTEQCQEANKNRICIDILEQEMKRDPIVGEELVTMPLYTDDLHMKLLYLENRVAFAKLFFPTEAKLAMKISETESTSVYLGDSATKSSAKLLEAELKETASIDNERLRLRLDALMKTVELGRRYFPHCSQVVDKYFEFDMPDLSYLEKGTPDEQKIKRMRYSEFKDQIKKALLKDKAQNSLSRSSSSSTTSWSPKGGVLYLSGLQAMGNIIDMSTEVRRQNGELTVQLFLTFLFNNVIVEQEVILDIRCMVVSYKMKQFVSLFCYKINLDDASYLRRS